MTSEQGNESVQLGYIRFSSCISPSH